MPSYYYFSATLPYLQPTATVPPFSYAEFLEQAGRFMSDKDMAVVRGLSLSLKDGGSPPPCADSSPLLAKYYRWESSLRNELAKLRAGRLSKPVDRYVRKADPEEESQRAAQAAFQAADPLQAELILERERWAYVESIAVNRFFDMEFILAYGLRLLILERRARFDVELGQEGYRTVYRSVLDTADYREESGEIK